MTGEEIDKLKLLTDWLIDTANRFINIFLVEGVSPEQQQLVKIGIVVAGLLLILGLGLLVYKIISKVIEPLISSLSQNPERVFYLIMAVLLLFFTSEVSFKAGCFALAGFIAIELGYRYYKGNQANQRNDR